MPREKSKIRCWMKYLPSSSHLKFPLSAGLLQWKKYYVSLVFVSCFAPFLQSSIYYLCAITYTVKADALNTFFTPPLTHRIDVGKRELTPTRILSSFGKLCEYIFGNKICLIKYKRKFERFPYSCVTSFSRMPILLAVVLVAWLDVNRCAAFVRIYL